MTFALNPKWEKSVQAKGMARFRVLRTSREADGELISWKERGRPTRVFNDPLLIVFLSPVKYEGVKVFDHQQKCVQSSLYTRLSSLEYSWEQNRHSPCYFGAYVAHIRGQHTLRTWVSFRLVQWKLMGDVNDLGGTSGLWASLCPWLAVWYAVSWEVSLGLYFHIWSWGCWI